MIGLDVIGADEMKWGSGGEGDQGPPAASAPTMEKATVIEAPKPVALTKPTEETPEWARPSEGLSTKWLIIGGVAAAVVGAVILFFAGGRK